ncbi:FAD linked oxidase [Lasiodiplodia theobromae]|uniref:FAD linked oxidase n=1 Tax=Lasiodiplodia theobromae TaxID=45133 RepID=UPI0015C2F533|nr:FAD linked oxidase [Lasiodiplodia theobromae]KAF4539443.1 FAD linked oxidase [Lasiodiplodia theobromae]
MIRPTSLLLAALALTALPFSNAGSSAASDACDQIDSKISSASDIVSKLNPAFVHDIHHWYLSSSQIPECVFEPGSVDDLATAMEIISSTRSPFAVKSGGHASNPGFSSTPGVHISLKRMDQIVLSEDNSTVEIGMGLTWADVYEELDDAGYNVVGGRVVGPGVGGFTLGGGFSWKTNQYGLTCDTVKSFTLVFPNGTITRVDSEQPDLFFALKGGLNRFGVVASAEFYTHEQPPQVYGGVKVYGSDEIDAVLNATAQFDAENTDPKAQIITTLRGEPTLRKTMIKHSGVSVSYDIEPFLKTWGEHATESAYPHTNSPLPLNMDFAWLSSDDDEYWYNAMRSSVNRLKDVAMQEGIHSNFTTYPNYAITNTTAEELYGTQNAARLRSIRNQVDPDRVMELAGGFSI